MEHKPERNTTNENKGEKVGKLFIQNLVDAYKFVNTEDKPKSPFLTEEDTSLLVEELTEDEDIMLYNVYTDLYSYIVKVTTNTSLCVRQIQVSTWRVTDMLSSLCDAEFDNIMHRLYPLVMTPKQYAEVGDKETDRMISVIDEAHLDKYNFYIDDRGYYVEPRTSWEYYLSENFLERRSRLVEFELNSIREEIKSWYAFTEVIKNIGDLIDIPELTVLCEKLPVEEIAFMNSFVNTALEMEIERYGDRENELTPKKIKSEIRKIAKPINIEVLKPSQNNIAKVKKMMNDITVTRGNMEHIYEILKK